MHVQVFIRVSDYVTYILTDIHIYIHTVKMYANLWLLKGISTSFIASYIAIITY